MDRRSDDPTDHETMPRDATEYLSHLAIERGLSANTVTAYRRDLTDYFSFLGHRDPTPETMDDFVLELHARELSRSTIARRVAAVRGLYRFLTVEGMAESDPTRLIDTPRPSFAFPKALEVDQVLALLEGPDVKSVLGRRDRAILEFMYGTGARVSETTGTDLTDIEWESRTVLVTGKGNKQRIIPLGSHALRAIELYLPDRLDLAQSGDDGALFLNSRGARLSRQGVFGIVKRHAARSGLDTRDVSPHVLRHSAATHMVEGGADLRTVQEMLGHATINTTQIYTKMSLRHLHEVYLDAHPRGR